MRKVIINLAWIALGVASLVATYIFSSKGMIPDASVDSTYISWGFLLVVRVCKLVYAIADSGITSNIVNAG